MGSSYKELKQTFSRYNVFQQLILKILQVISAFLLRIAASVVPKCLLNSQKTFNKTSEHVAEKNCTIQMAIDYLMAFGIDYLMIWNHDPHSTIHLLTSYQSCTTIMGQSNSASSHAEAERSFSS